MARLKCPFCRKTNSTVLRTRQKEVGLKRLHKCPECGERFFALEIPSAILFEITGATDEQKLAEIIGKGYTDYQKKTEGEQ